MVVMMTMMMTMMVMMMTMMMTMMMMMMIVMQMMMLQPNQLNCAPQECTIHSITSLMDLFISRIHSVFMAENA